MTLEEIQAARKSVREMQGKDEPQPYWMSIAESMNQHGDIIRKALDITAAVQEDIEAGCVMVPKNATKPMCKASGFSANQDRGGFYPIPLSKLMYKAAIAAAPKSKVMETIGE